MIIKIEDKNCIQYKETHHQLYVYSYEKYLERFARNLSEGEREGVSPEAVVVYNYIDGGGGHLHLFKGSSVYLMNNDGKTVDVYRYNYA